MDLPTPRSCHVPPGPFALRALVPAPVRPGGARLLPHARPGLRHPRPRLRRRRRPSHGARPQLHSAAGARGELLGHAGGRRLRPGRAGRSPASTAPTTATCWRCWAAARTGCGGWRWSAPASPTGNWKPCTRPGCGGCASTSPSQAGASASTPWRPWPGASPPWAGTCSSCWTAATCPGSCRACAGCPARGSSTTWGTCPRPWAWAIRPSRPVRELAAGRGWCVKLSGAYRLSADFDGFKEVAPIARELIAAAPERMLWGSDWPHVAMARIPDTGRLRNLLPDWAPDAAPATASWWTTRPGSTDSEPEPAAAPGGRASAGAGLGHGGRRIEDFPRPRRIFPSCPAPIPPIGRAGTLELCLAGDPRIAHTSSPLPGVPPPRPGGDPRCPPSGPRASFLEHLRGLSRRGKCFVQRTPGRKGKPWPSRCRRSSSSTP